MARAGPLGSLPGASAMGPQASLQGPQGATQATSQFQGLLKVINSVNLGVTALSASFLAVSRGAEIVGRTASAAFTMVRREIQGLAEDIIHATEVTRNLTATFAGSTGSMGLARNIVGTLREMSNQIPISLEGLGNVIKAVSLVPGLKPLLKDTENLEGNMTRMVNIVRGLMTLRPTLGIDSAVFAFREALTGNFISLMRRFEVSPDLIAATIGKTREQMRTAGPIGIISALENFLEQNVGGKTIESFTQQFTNRIRLVKNLLENFRTDIGEAGFYDAAVVQINRVVTALDQFRKTQAYVDGIKQISSALKGIVEAVAETGRTLGEIFAQAFFPGSTPLEAITRGVGAGLMFVKTQLELIRVTLDSQKSSWVDTFRSMASSVKEFSQQIPAIVAGLSQVALQMGKVAASAVAFTATNPGLVAGGAVAGTILGAAGARRLGMGALQGAASEETRIAAEVAAQKLAEEKAREKSAKLLAAGAAGATVQGVAGAAGGETSGIAAALATESTKAASARTAYLGAAGGLSAGLVQAADAQRVAQNNAVRLQRAEERLREAQREQRLARTARVTGARGAAARAAREAGRSTGSGSAVREAVRTVETEAARLASSVARASVAAARIPDLILAKNMAATAVAPSTWPMPPTLIPAGRTMLESAAVSEGGGILGGLRGLPLIAPSTQRALGGAGAAALAATGTAVASSPAAKTFTKEILGLFADLFRELAVFVRFHVNDLGRLLLAGTGISAAGAGAAFVGRNMLADAGRLTRLPLIAPSTQAALGATGAAVKATATAGVELLKDIAAPLNAGLAKVLTGVAGAAVLFLRAFNWVNLGAMLTGGILWGLDKAFTVVAGDLTSSSTLGIFFEVAGRIAKGTWSALTSAFDAVFLTIPREVIGGIVRGVGRLANPDLYAASAGAVSAETASTFQGRLVGTEAKVRERLAQLTPDQLKVVGKDLEGVLANLADVGVQARSMAASKMLDGTLLALLDQRAQGAERSIEKVNEALEKENKARERLTESFNAYLNSLHRADPAFSRFSESMEKLISTPALKAAQQAREAQTAFAQYMTNLSGAAVETADLFKARPEARAEFMAGARKHASLQEALFQEQLKLETVSELYQQSSTKKKKALNDQLTQQLALVIDAEERVRLAEHAQRQLKDRLDAQKKFWGSFDEGMKEVVDAVDKYHKTLELVGEKSAATQEAMKKALDAVAAMFTILMGNLKSFVFDIQTAASDLLEGLGVKGSLAERVAPGVSGSVASGAGRLLSGLMSTGQALFGAATGLPEQHGPPEDQGVAGIMKSAEEKREANLKSGALRLQGLNAQSGGGGSGKSKEQELIERFAPPAVKLREELDKLQKIHEDAFRKIGTTKEIVLGRANEQIFQAEKRYLEEITQSATVSAAARRKAAIELGNLESEDLTRKLAQAQGMVSDFFERGGIPGTLAKGGKTARSIGGRGVSRSMLSRTVQDLMSGVTAELERSGEVRPGALNTLGDAQLIERLQERLRIQQLEIPLGQRLLELARERGLATHDLVQIEDEILRKMTEQERPAREIAELMRQKLSDEQRIRQHEMEINQEMLKGNLTLQDRAAILEKLAASTEQSVEAQARFTIEAERANDALASRQAEVGARVAGDESAPFSARMRGQRDIESAIDRGVEVDDAFGTGMRSVGLGVGSPSARAFRLGQQVAGNFRDAFAAGFEALFTGKDLKDVFRNLIQGLIRTISQSLADDLTAGIFGGGGGKEGAVKGVASTLMGAVSKQGTQETGLAYAQRATGGMQESLTQAVGGSLPAPFGNLLGKMGNTVQAQQSTAATLGQAANMLIEAANALMQAAQQLGQEAGGGGLAGALTGGSKGGGILSSVFGSVVSSVVGKPSGYSTVSGTGGTAGGFVNSVMGSVGPGILGAVSGLPFFAEGGIVSRPTLAMLGEKGPEAVVPLSKMSPSSASWGKEQGGGKTIEVQLHVTNTVDEDGFHSKVNKAVTRETVAARWMEEHEAGSGLRTLVQRTANGG